MITAGKLRCPKVYWHHTLLHRKSHQNQWEQYFIWEWELLKSRKYGELVLVPGKCEAAFWWRAELRFSLNSLIFHFIFPPNCYMDFCPFEKLLCFQAAASGGHCSGLCTSLDVNGCSNRWVLYCLCSLHCLRGEASSNHLPCIQFLLSHWAGLPTISDNLLIVPMEGIIQVSRWQVQK